MRRRTAAGVSAVAGAILLGVLTTGASAPSEEVAPPVPDPGPGLESAAPITDGLHITVDGPQYESVAALAEAAEVVVRGTFVAHTADVDEADLIPGAPEGFTGLPLELWEFQVTETLQGEAAGTITVTEVADGVEGVARSAAPGRDSVLFLRAYAEGAHPGDLYAVVGLGAGSLGVEGGTLTAPEDATSALVADVARLGDVQRVRSP